VHERDTFQGWTEKRLVNKLELVLLVGGGLDILGNMVGGLLGCHMEVQMGEPVTGWFGGRVDGESPEIRLLISVPYND